MLTTQPEPYNMQPIWSKKGTKWKYKVGCSTVSILFRKSANRCNFCNWKL